MDLGDEADLLLRAARERGRETIGMTIIPPALDKVTMYVGLLDRALELGKLVNTEERDLQVIGQHYTLEMTKINHACREIEAAMLAGFARDSKDQEETYKIINLLIEKGQFELADSFHKRLLDKFQRAPLDSIIDLLNKTGAASGVQFRLR